MNDEVAPSASADDWVLQSSKVQDATGRRAQSLPEQKRGGGAGGGVVDGGGLIPAGATEATSPSLK